MHSARTCQPEETQALIEAEACKKAKNRGFKDNYHEIKLYVMKMDDIY